MYKKPNLVQTFIEVNTHDTEGFMKDLQDISGEHGVSVTDISRALPVANGGANGDQSRYFMTLTGRADGSDGKPNSAQLHLLKSLSAKIYGSDQEAWAINKQVAINMADEHQPQNTQLSAEL